MAMSFTLVGTTVSAYDVNSAALVQGTNLEQTIIVDLSQGTVVTVDSSELERINANSRSSLLLCTGDVSFNTSGNSVNSPIFVTPFETGDTNLKFKPSDFVGEKKIDVTLYTHIGETDANLFTANNLGKLTFNAVVSYRILFTGTAASGIDYAYLKFTPHSDCATSFSYEVSLI